MKAVKSMGARGKVSKLGDPVRVRFWQDSETEMRVLAAMWSVTFQEVVRILTAEALLARQTDQGENRGSHTS
ncbi:hypothetical protein LWC35_18205 [Pseudonocardia kujensis]|uniref:hypothetical protein n=1 Tax=Pseudonocardia kujensis TaxID=1128675 RepID=UPI001E5CEFD3|nr:hypothetical protein [Pseudonocardia kujensis]MCE0764824.1 hypothetical protein [Pseudonocardia kujensis]